MVRLEADQVDGSGFSCGATLIHERFVLTAAHCVYDEDIRVNNIVLHFGDHHLSKEDDTQTLMVIPMSYVFRHPLYNSRTANNDIALIRLPKNAPISNHVRPVCITSESTASKFKSGTAMGWGFTRNEQHGGQQSEVLKQVDLPILPDTDCRLFRSFNSDNMICAGNIYGINAAVCTGDSGGPFVVKTKSDEFGLIGVSSYGSGKGCVTVGYGVVFVRVSNYIRWLRGLMESDLCIV